MNKKKFSMILSVALLLLLFMFGAVWLKRKTVAPEMAFSSARLTTVDEKKAVSIADYVGSVVIVSCFQTWCGDCARETPILNELSGRLAGEPFKVIYITDEQSGKLARFRSHLASNRILFTIADKSLADFGIHVYPTTFLLDKKGVVVLTKLEGHDWLKEEGKIRELLSE